MVGDYDSRFKMVVSFQVISWAAGLILVVLTLGSACYSFPEATYRTIGMTWIGLCTTLALLLFLALDSNLCTENPVLEELQLEAFYQDKCELGPGAVSVIIGGIGFFLTGVLTMMIPGDDEAGAPAREATDATEEKVVTEEEEAMPADMEEIPLDDEEEEVMVDGEEEPDLYEEEVVAESSEEEEILEDSDDEDVEEASGGDPNRPIYM